MINFKSLSFVLEDGCVYLKSIGDFECSAKSSFVEIQISGENKDTHLGAKMINSSEGRRLRYISHKASADTLEIIQRSELVEAKTVFTVYSDCDAVRVYTEVKNISDEKIYLEEVSSFVLYGIAVGIVAFVLM